MTPPVSVFLFCRNRAQTIRRSVDSVLAQTFSDFEYVIQDGASTDGTLDILREYGDPRIVLRSEPDAGPADAFWTALKRCRGAYIGACLSDEALEPDAVGHAVAYLDRHRDAAALTRDAHMTDLDGRVTRVIGGEPFDLARYAANRFAPQFSAALFRRTALDAAGLHTRAWDLECGEFELWCRLALVGPIAYEPRVAVRYAQHDAQLSRDPRNVTLLAAGRLRVIDRLAAEGVLAAPAQHRDARVATALSFGRHLIDLGARGKGVALMLSVADASGRLPAPRAADTPATDWVHAAHGERVDDRPRLALRILETARLLARVDAAVPFEIAQTYADEGRIARALEMYDEAVALDPGHLEAHWERGVLLERRGQIDEAIEAWRQSDVTRSAHRHSLLLAAILKSPRATNESVLEAHREWARHHAGTASADMAR
jgi:glycosyltransferase involved in cell wall biosynthesis